MNIIDNKLWLLPVLVLAVSCNSMVPLVESTPANQFDFYNDTEYICQICWDQSYNSSDNHQQTISISPNSVHSQYFLPFNTNGISTEGESLLVLGFNTHVRFVLDNDSETSFEYIIPRDPSVQISSKDCFWTRLTHYEYSQVKTDEKFCNISTFYLSDILKMAMNGDAEPN